MSSAIRTGYSGRQIFLHWAIAALVLVQLVFGESMVAVMRAAGRGVAAPVLDQRLAVLHYWVGITILLLLVLRVGLRLALGAPVVVGITPIFTKLAGAVHGIFYLLLVLVPVTGLLGYYFGGLWGDLHALGKPVFIVLIALHVVGALFHQFWMKDGTLRRMLVPQRD